MVYGVQINSSGRITGKFSGAVLDPLFTEVTEIEFASVEPGSTYLNGAISPPPGPTLAQAKATQSGIIAAACSAAESTPLAFTNAAGVNSTFPMDSGSLTKYLGAYAKYYVKGLPFPNSATTYNFYDVTAKAVAMSLTDIENFFNAVETQIDGALAKQETLLADIAAATTVTAAQAVVW